MNFSFKGFVFNLLGLFVFIFLGILVLGIPMFGFLYGLATGEINPTLANSDIIDLFNISFKISVPIDILFSFIFATNTPKKK
jgi:hypothetical protein